MLLQIKRIVVQADRSSVQLNVIGLKAATNHCFTVFSDNKLQEELLKTTQLVYINQDGKGMVSALYMSIVIRKTKGLSCKPNFYVS